VVLCQGATESAENEITPKNEDIRMVGRVYPSEKATFRDKESGAEIIQFTSLGDTNRTLYFTNRPYTCDKEHVVFLSNRTGRNEMFLLHLKSGKITQLTELEGQRNVSNCVHPTRPELYFHNTSSLYRVQLDTLKTEELLSAPEGFMIGILNLNNPPWLAFELIEKRTGMSRIQEGKPMPAGDGFELHYLRPRSLIYRFNVDSGKLECLWSDLKLLTHVQISPTNPDLLIFSDFCGYGSDRVYYLNLKKKIKSPPRPLLGETQTSRGGHECFTRKGNLYLQWMEGDLQEDGDHQLMHAFKSLEGCPMDRVEAAPFRRYALPEKMGYMGHHFTMNADETWGVHDRWLTAPSFEENMSWLSLFKHQDKEPQTVVLKLCHHNGHKGDRINLGAELTLNDDDEWATYTSFLGGTANVCQVRVTPFVEKLMKM
jgi:oligogalacturonide lyase